MNINKLKGKIVENGMNNARFAAAIGINYATLCRKLKAPEKITIGEAAKMKIALNLTDADAIEIFLA